MNGGPPGDLYVQVQVKPHAVSNATTTTCPARCQDSARHNPSSTAEKNRRQS
jgi:hypothetical protein